MKTKFFAGFFLFIFSFPVLSKNIAVLPFQWKNWKNGTVLFSLVSSILLFGVIGYKFILNAETKPATVDVTNATTDTKTNIAPAFDKFSLWSNGTRLRGANIYQRMVYPDVYDDPAAWGNGPFGLVFTQQDFDALSAVGANLVVLSHPGLYDDKPPYAFNQSAQDNLDKFIDMAKKANLFVVIALRTGPGRSELEIWASTTTCTTFEKSHINDNVWTDKNAQDKWVEMWRYTAARYRNSPVVVGYELMVEPDPNAFWLHTYEPSDFYPTYANTTYDWNQLYPRISAAIREVDKETPILIGGMNWSGVGWLSSLKPTGDKRTVYIIHQYEPQVQYTHQDYSVTPKMLGYPGKLNWDGNDVPFNSTWFDAWLSSVDKFKSDYRAPVAVTEYGVARWVPGGAQYLGDEMARFEKSGMNYAVWSWQPSSNAHTVEQNDFNVRMGTDPANIAEGNSEIYDTLKKYWAKNTAKPTSVSTPKNLIVSMNLQTVHSSPVLGGKSGIEIVVWASDGFPVRNEIAVLRIGSKEFTLSRYLESGDLHTLIFTLTPEEFAKTATGDSVTVYYGHGDEASEHWDFGTLDKSLSAKSLPPQEPYGSSNPSTAVVNAEDSGDVYLKNINSKVLIGSYIENKFADTTYANLAAKEFNAGQSLWYAGLGGGWQSKNSYDFSDFNAVVNWLKQNGISTHMHMLIGPNFYMPDWLVKGTWTNEQLDALLKNMIYSIMDANNNKNKVDVWNVVNESFYDEGDYATNADNIWYQLGWEEDQSGLSGADKINTRHPVYIRKAFQYARDKTKAKLEYREHLEGNNPASSRDRKNKAVYQLLKHMLNSGIPVDAVGIQGHLDIGNVNRLTQNNELQNTVEKFKELGLEVYITELDIGTAGQTWNDALAIQQKTDYYNYIRQAINGGVDRIYTWGIADGSDSDWRTNEHPLPWDKNYKRKPAYYGIVQALKDTR